MDKEPEQQEVADEEDDDEEEEEESDAEQGDQKETETDKLNEMAGGDDDVELDGDETKGLDPFQLVRWKKKRAAELAKMKDFADRNGFEIIDEKRTKFFDHYDALTNFKVTKEWIAEKQREAFVANFVPPPLELLQRKFTNKEPIRTGFNQGLLEIGLLNNWESKRTPQGPQIVITNSTVAAQ